MQPAMSGPTDEANSESTRFKAGVSWAMVQDLPIHMVHPREVGPHMIGGATAAT